MNQTQTLKTIVIGTSLTEASDAVVRTGVTLARLTGAEPWLVHAYTVQALPSELGATDGPWVEQQMEVLRERLTLQAQRTGLASLPGFVPSRLRLETGPTHGGILDVAREAGADLVVVGGSEGGALRRFLLGSTADGVIRQSPCPVFVVRSAPAFPPSRVEVAVDLSPLSGEALRQGMDFLARTGAAAAETEVLFVLNPLEAAGSLQFTPEQVERFARGELRRLLEENGLSPALARVRSGYPWEEILAAVEERRADLVVLGTHGRRGVERMLLGSVAAGVMHRAPCNLLVVPPGAAFSSIGAEERADAAGADWSFVPDQVLAPA